MLSDPSLLLALFVLVVDAAQELPYHAEYKQLTMASSESPGLLKAQLLTTQRFLLRHHFLFLAPTSFSAQTYARRVRRSRGFLQEQRFRHDHRDDSDLAFPVDKRGP